MIHRSFASLARRHALLLAAVASALAPAHAGAAPAARPAPMHATLLSSEPATGSTITSSPARIYLVFSEEVEPSLGAIRLVGPAGRVVAIKPVGDPRNVSALVGRLGAALEPGTWRVEWRIVSEDGHPIDGDFTFAIAGADGAVPATAPPTVVDSAHGAPPPESAAARTPSTDSALADVPVGAATLRGLGVGFLCAFLGFVVLHGSRRDRARQPRAERVAMVLGIAMAITLVLHLLVWTIAVTPDHSLGAEQMSAMLASRVGQLELWRTGLALLACWALLLARRDRLAVAFAAGAIAVSSATGHSAAIHPAWTIPMRGIHLFAVAAWLGGLLWLLSLERSVDTIAAESERVSSGALLAVIAVSLTGLVQTKFFIGEWADLVRSAYGFLALAKIAGLGVLVLFGAHHRYRVLPRLAQDGVADGYVRTLRSEVLVLTLVILVGGLLAYVPPPQH